MTLSLWMIVILGYAQYDNYLHIPTIDIFRYQLQKKKDASTIAPFRRYGLRRIRAAKYVPDSDPRHIWGWHLKANTEYDINRDQLYKLFKKADFTSIGIIDTQNGDLEIVFWDKFYYLIFTNELRQFGYTSSLSNKMTNVIQFRKADTSVLVDVTIWYDIYIMRFFTI